MVPEPGMPPSEEEATLAMPCATSSRFDSCRLRVSWSITTQVFKVSIDSRAARVRALPNRPAIWLRCSSPISSQRSVMALT